MDKYKELTTLAARFAGELSRSRLDYRIFAQNLMRKLAEYLGCPPENIIHYEVTEDLTPGKRGLPMRNSLPEVTQGCDGFHYFAVEFEFKTKEQFMVMSMYCMFGMKKSGDTCTIRYGKDFDVDPESECDLGRFYDFFYQDMKIGLEHPVNEQRKKIGFHEP